MSPNHEADSRRPGQEEVEPRTSSPSSCPGVRSSGWCRPLGSDLRHTDRPIARAVRSAWSRSWLPLSQSRQQGGFILIMRCMREVAVGYRQLQMRPVRPAHKKTLVPMEGEALTLARTCDDLQAHPHAFGRARVDRRRGHGLAGVSATIPIPARAFFRSALGILGRSSPTLRRFSDATARIGDIFLMLRPIVPYAPDAIFVANEIFRQLIDRTEGRIACGVVFQTRAVGQRGTPRGRLANGLRTRLRRSGLRLPGSAPPTVLQVRHDQIDQQLSPTRRAFAQSSGLKEVLDAGGRLRLERFFPNGLRIGRRPRTSTVALSQSPARWTARGGCSRFHLLLPDLPDSL